MLDQFEEEANGFYQKFQRFYEEVAEQKVHFSQMEELYNFGIEIFPTNDEVSAIQSNEYLRKPQKDKKAKLKYVWMEYDIKVLIWLVVKVTVMNNRSLNSISKTDWFTISQMMRRGDALQCKIKWLQMSKESALVRNVPWNDNEDERLIQIVSKFQNSKELDWKLIATMLNNSSNRITDRNSRQCEFRWNRYLNPQVDRTAWKRTEDIEILQQVLNHGQKWKFIQEQFLPSRNWQDIKSRYMYVLKNEKRVKQGLDKNQLIIQIINELKELNDQNETETLNTKSNQTNSQQRNYYLNRWTPPCYIKFWQECEDLELMKLVLAHGRKWEFIRTQLTKKNIFASSIKKRFRQLLLQQKTVYLEFLKEQIRQKQNIQFKDFEYSDDQRIRFWLRHHNSNKFIVESTIRKVPRSARKSPQSPPPLPTQAQISFEIQGRKTYFKCYNDKELYTTESYQLYKSYLMCKSCFMKTKDQDFETDSEKLKKDTSHMMRQLRATTISGLIFKYFMITEFNTYNL